MGCSWWTAASLGTLRETQQPDAPLRKRSSGHVLAVRSWASTLPDPPHWSPSHRPAPEAEKEGGPGWMGGRERKMAFYCLHLLVKSTPTSQPFNNTTAPLTLPLWPPPANTSNIFHMEAGWTPGPIVYSSIRPSSPPSKNGHNKRTFIFCENAAWLLDAEGLLQGKKEIMCKSFAMCCKIAKEDDKK